MLLSHNTSSCWCSVVASLPLDTVPALLSDDARDAVKRRVAALHVCPSRHSLAACNGCVVAAVVCQVLVCTRIASLSSRCDLHDRCSVSGLSSGMTVSRTCALSCSVRRASSSSMPPKTNVFCETDGVESAHDLVTENVAVLERKHAVCWLAFHSM